MDRLTRAIAYKDFGLTAEAALAEAEKDVSLEREREREQYQLSLQQIQLQLKQIEVAKDQPKRILGNLYLKEENVSVSITDSLVSRKSGEQSRNGPYSHPSNHRVASQTGSRKSSNTSLVVSHKGSVKSSSIHSSNHSLASNITGAQSKASGPPKFVQDLISDHKNRIDRFNESNKDAYMLQFCDRGNALRVVNLNTDRKRQGSSIIILTLHNSVEANTFFANINYEQNDFSSYLHKKDSGTLHFLFPETTPSLVARFEDTVTMITKGP